MVAYPDTEEKVNTSVIQTISFFHCPHVVIIAKGVQIIEVTVYFDTNNYYYLTLALA